MKFQKLIAHLVIILSLCFLAFSVLDWYNPMMNFSGNVISSKLLPALCIGSIVLAVLAILPKREGPAKPAHAIHTSRGHR